MLDVLAILNPPAVKVELGKAFQYRTRAEGDEQDVEHDHRYQEEKCKN